MSTALPEPPHAWAQDFDLGPGLQNLAHLGLRVFEYRPD